MHNEILHDQDVAAAKEEGLYAGTLTPEEKIIEKKLRRKIDTLIMPLVVLVYLMNYIDRNNYAAAKLQGLQETLQLSDPQYQLGLSILFAGYVSRDQSCLRIMSLTMNRCSCKFPPIYSSTTVDDRHTILVSSSACGAWYLP